MIPTFIGIGNVRQILYRISNILHIHYIITVKDFTVETFFNKQIIHADLTTLLQFFEYDDDGMICNPEDVNHHNANTGETTYKELLQKCRVMTKGITTDGTRNNNPISNDTNDIPFKSFEFVLYKKSCSESNQSHKVFDIKRTIPEKENDTQGKKEKGMFVIDDEEKKKFLNLVNIISDPEPHTTQMILENIKNYQQTSSLRLGIVDGLHRITAFNTILRHNKPEDIFTNIASCVCHMYIIKPDNSKEMPSSELRYLFKMKSQLISKNQSKSISHTLYDTIMEIIADINTRAECNYIHDIKKTSLIEFMAAVSEKNRESSFCASKYLKIFLYSHIKLLTDCKKYEEEFMRRFLNTKSSLKQPTSPSDETYLTDVFPKILNTPFTIQAIPRILNNENPDHSLTKQNKFCVPCACVHRLLSAYMTFDNKDAITSGLLALQHLGLANLRDISLTVTYADALASILLDSMKGTKRNLRIGHNNFHRIVSNYLITSLLKGIKRLQDLTHDQTLKMFNEWGMADFPDVNKYCPCPSDNLIDYIDWDGNKYMVIMGIYFNYATHIMDQSSLFPQNGFITLPDLKKSDLKKQNTEANFFEIKEAMHLQAINNETEHVPILFDSFVRKIRQSISTNDKSIYEEGGSWQIYHPEQIGRRYKGWTFKKAITQKEAQEPTINLSNKTYNTYKEWQNDSKFTEKELSDISTRIIQEFLSKKNFKSHVTAILQENTQPSDDDSNDQEEQNDVDSNDSASDEPEKNTTGNKRKASQEPTGMTTRARKEKKS